MIPRDRRTALVAILEAEREVKALALESYRQWLPIAREAVLDPESVRAAAEEPPPDPEAIALTQADWEAILAGVFLPGLAALLWAQLTAEMTSLGLTPEEITRLIAATRRRSGGDEDEDEEGEPRPARRQGRRSQSDPDRSPDDDDSEDDDEPADDSDEPDLPEPPKDSDKPDGGRDDGDRDDDELTPELVAKIPEVQDWVDAYLAAVRNRMVRTPDTAFRLIADELAEATRLGESIDQQRDRVARILDAENLDTFGGRRAALVARTETCGALNGARLEAARVMAEVTGEELEKAWLSTIDNRTRSTHFAADGQRVAIDAAFTMASGATLRWPGDPEAPASEVCNCRCALFILAVDEELPAEDDRQTERGPGDSTVRNREGDRQDEIDRRREEDGIVRARDDPDGIGEINAAAPPPERIRTMTTRFRTTLAFLGQVTDDGRMLAADMDLRFRDTPMPLLWQEKTGFGHEGAVAVGVVDSIELVDDRVEATGYFLDTDDADKALVQVRAGITNPSIDPADVMWELRDQDGNTITSEAEWEAAERVIEVYTSAIVTAATLVNIPAFGSTAITVDEETDEDDEDEEPGEDWETAAAVLLAAVGAPRFRPDPVLFSDPGFEEPTPLHLTADGRVQGHLAVFGVCHVGISDRCVQPPQSMAAYAHFHTSAVETGDGAWLPVGRLTVGTGHADHGLSARAAAEHYDNTGTCWAYVCAGEDAHGIWVSGVVHPEATEMQVREGLSAPLSGDWRRIGGNLELVAALSVNVPGFPVLRGHDDERGRARVLVASLAPRARLRADQQLLHDVALTAIREWHRTERRRVEAFELIQSRRRRQARALVAAVRSRKG